MSDVCERLVRFAGKVCLSTDTEVEAADEIERLRAENEKLRAEVNDLRATLRNCLTDANFMRAAAAALKETGDEA